MKVSANEPRSTATAIKAVVSSGAGVPPTGGRQGSVFLGLGMGMLVLAFFAWLVAVNQQASPEVPGTIGTLSFVIYVVLAIILTARQKTTRFGAGLLFAIGACLLIGAGVCFALIAGVGR